MLSHHAFQSSYPVIEVVHELREVVRVLAAHLRLVMLRENIIEILFVYGISQGRFSAICDRSRYKESFFREKIPSCPKRLLVLFSQNLSILFGRDRIGRNKHES